MVRVSPLREIHAQAGATYTPYGPPDAAIPVVQARDAFELEYAAIRKSSALFDEPHMGVVEVVGADSQDFLSRMLTQKLDMGAGVSRPSFWLNRQGRIVADLRVLVFDKAVLLLCDALTSASVVETLGAYLFAEDVSLRDMTDSWHRMSLHGPEAFAILRSVAHDSDALCAALASPGACAQGVIAGERVSFDRSAVTGATGLSLIMQSAGASAVWQTLEDAGARPIGWQALNVARVEAGEPLWNVDFGADSLPHETGVVESRVSLTKGCYLGQEIVARMASRGKSAKRLCAIRLQRVVAPETDSPLQSMTGDAVRLDVTSDPIGAVTSSVVSPLLGDTPICFAVLSTKHADASAKVLIDAQGQQIEGAVQKQLRFLPASGLSRK